MSETVLLYVTCAKHEEALRIARALLGDRLIACANILPQHTALYRWDGQVREEPEVSMLLKTRVEMTVHVSERIKAMHSASVPCVVAIPIQGGNPDFLTWITREVDSD